MVSTQVTKQTRKIQMKNTHKMRNTGTQSDKDLNILSSSYVQNELGNMIKLDKCSFFLFSSNTYR